MIPKTIKVLVYLILAQSWAVSSWAADSFGDPRRPGMEVHVLDTDEMNVREYVDGSFLFELNNESQNVLYLKSDGEAFWMDPAGPKSGRWDKATGNVSGIKGLPADLAANVRKTITNLRSIEPAAMSAKRTAYTTDPDADMKMKTKKGNIEFTDDKKKAIV